MNKIHVLLLRHSTKSWLPYSRDYYPLLNCTRSRIVPAPKEEEVSIVPALELYPQFKEFLYFTPKKCNFWVFLANLRGQLWIFQLIPALELYPLSINARTGRWWKRIVPAGSNHVSTVFVKMLLKELACSNLHLRSHYNQKFWNLVKKFELIFWILQCNNLIWTFVATKLIDLFWIEASSHFPDVIIA